MVTLSYPVGEISNNNAATNGGCVYSKGLSDKVTFTMNNGKISNNTAKLEGGGVSVVTGGLLKWLKALSLIIGQHQVVGCTCLKVFSSY
jgi:hypothetical protein